MISRFTPTANLICTLLPCLSLLIFRPPRRISTRNPVQRVKESEFPLPGKKVRFMAAQAENTIKPKSRIPTASSSWDEDTLKLLNAKFDMNVKHRQGNVIESFGINVQFDIPEDAQKSLLPSFMMLTVVINATAEAFLRVNNGVALRPKYVFDDLKHPQLAQFLPFYDKLEESLLRKSESQQSGNPTSRPSSGDATLEKVTDNIANDFLRATFYVTRLRTDHFWWATQHKSEMVLRHQGYSLFSSVF